MGFISAEIQALVNPRGLCMRVCGVCVCARVTLADRFGDCVGVLCLRATTVTPRHLSE